MSKAKASAAVWAVWIILTILIAGGLVYYYQYTKIPDLQNQINNLKNQVSELQKQISEKPTDETADWETYENAKYGYSVKYPKDWNLYTKGFYDASTKTYKEPAKSVVIDNEEIEDIPYASEYPMNGFIINAGQDEFTFSQLRQDTSMTFTDEQIAGENALRAVSKSASEMDGSFGTYYYINYNSQGYVILWPNDNASGKHDEIYDTILSTFQFTD
jgi:hypothetical protein